MDTTASKIRRHLDSITRYLTPLLPIANCHMVEFLTENHWETLIPTPLRESLEKRELNDCVEKFWVAAEGKSSGTPELDAWVQEARAHYITFNEYTITARQLQDRIKAWGGDLQPEIRVSEFMNSKKSYEVQTMSHLVASLHKACGATCCVEAGGGRGHLLAALALGHGVPSLTIDCDPAAVQTAAQRVRLIQKQWHAIAKRVYNGTEEEMSKNINCDIHRFATAFITENTDLTTVVREAFPDHDQVKLLLTGLHTCGNLGPDSLRIFRTQPTTAAIFNVPCCYHLLTEELDEGVFDCFQRNFGTGGKSQGFPMSEYLRGFNLGRNARMLAAQSIDRVVSQRQLPVQSLLYRALLQVIIKENRPNSSLPEGKLKRLSKCENFEQYLKMADSILNLNLFDSSTRVLSELYPNIDQQWKKMTLFYLLRLCLAQVIESVILLDRLLYLNENGFDKVFLVKLFDPVLSPRCHSIVAVR
ncbi:methyltransferase-like protein 25 isoform X2 [Hyposmocoma kahamanoa]|nr:methyltransferase-like protein 25 isoform X2 [Hyposmocoma kahamanoa]XP_026330747.1 methyltransferase-like protein 25 isoform X2 [Hyposmocoma kahamanoa]XP_026330748.1 methyltransferase-like protein 25 isoform X2 [Hyposmocoma kahamanoa]